jgi:hypothetical protein
MKCESRRIKVCDIREIRHSDTPFQVLHGFPASFGQQFCQVFGPQVGIPS